MPSDSPHPAARPFSGPPSPATFHCAPAQEEVLARIEWVHEHRQRFALVTAVAGGGKSHLLAAVTRRLAGAGSEVALLALRGLEPDAWLDLLLERLPLDPASRADPGRPWSKLEARCRENTLMERTTALVFDDLDRAPADAVAGVERLVGAVEARFSRVLVVATATPEGCGALPATLRAQAAIRIELAPWTDDEVAGYLVWEAERVGAPPLFSPAAAGAIARFSGGVPRVVVHLARLSLAAAAGAGQRVADAAVVERAWCELHPAAVASVILPVDDHAPTRQAADGRATTAPEGGDASAAPTVRPVRRLWG